MLHVSEMTGELMAYGQTSDQKLLNNPLTVMNKSYTDSYAQLIDQSIQETKDRIYMQKAKEALATRNQATPMETEEVQPIMKEIPQ